MRHLICVMLAGLVVIIVAIGGCARQKEKPTRPPSGGAAGGADPALKYLRDNDGWEIGTSPSVVILDTGAAASLTTMTAKDDVYAVFFDQKGLMAGLGLQGSKISRINP